MSIQRKVTTMKITETKVVTKTTITCDYGYGSPDVSITYSVLEKKNGVFNVARTGLKTPDSSSGQKEIVTQETTPHGALLFYRDAIEGMNNY